MCVCVFGGGGGGGVVVGGDGGSLLVGLLEYRVVESVVCLVGLFVMKRNL